MPEGVEVEIYRQRAELVVGRLATAVIAPDPWILKGVSAQQVTDAVLGQKVEAARRRGKLLILDWSNEVRMGIRFGMTGTLFVDGDAAIDQLEYSSTRRDPAWDRFAIRFDDGGELRLHDPRRLGGINLDPDEDALGADAFSVTLGHLQKRIFVGKVAIKARLLDQARLAGVGNLIADEVMWRAGLDPARQADSFTEAEQRRLHSHLRKVLTDFTRDGGSHTGKLHDSRQRGGHCPKDGMELLRREIGGRTTFSCPEHQV